MQRLEQQTTRTYHPSVAEPSDINQRTFSQKRGYVLTKSSLDVDSDRVREDGVLPGINSVRCLHRITTDPLAEGTEVVVVDEDLPGIADVLDDDGSLGEVGAEGTLKVGKNDLGTPLAVCGATVQHDVVVEATEAEVKKVVAEVVQQVDARVVERGGLGEVEGGRDDIS